MIHLDTNYLIGLLVKGSPQAVDVAGWLAAGELLATSAVVWTEFLNGPATAAEVGRAEAVLQSRLVPFFAPSESLQLERETVTFNIQLSTFNPHPALSAAAPGVSGDSVL